MAQSSRFVFTLNNYTSDEVDVLRGAIGSPLVQFIIFGKEVGAQNGTPHLQGFVIFNRSVRRAQVLRILGARLYLQPARGTSEQARDYCRKGTQSHEEWEQLGTNGPNFGNGSDVESYGEFPDGQGRRSDLQRCIEWADQFHADNRRAITLRDVAMSHPEIAIKYPRFVEVLRSRFTPPAFIDHDVVELRPWQLELEEELNAEADDRIITFVEDPIGGKGKTWFAKYMLSKHPDRVQILSVAKRDDMAYMLDETKNIFFVNVPRGGMEFLQYTILEMIKDRIVTSPKYQSCQKILTENCHVIVLCNEHLDETKLSVDRIKVIDLLNAE